MEVVITEWAKQSYLEFVSKQIFTRAEYVQTLRPDAERLKNFPQDPKFGQSNFWGPAKQGSQTIQHGFKMKWHNIGSGTVQLRLLVVIHSSDLHGVRADRAFLCESYVKSSPSVGQRKMAKIKNRIKDIAQGTYYYRGLL